MALLTAGTNATTSLAALKFLKGSPAADVALIANNILNDRVNGNPIWPGAFSNNGVLFIPNRGELKVFSGDYVMYDSTGWPILISANAIANGPWTHS